MGIIDSARAALAPTAIAQAFRRADTPRLGRKGPPLSGRILPVPSAVHELVRYLAEDPDHAKWFAAMRRADRGQTSDMVDVFSDSLDRDPHLRGLYQKRVTSMMGRPIVFRPPDGFERDPDALRIAENVRRVLLLESRRFRSMLSHLMTGAPNGFAVSPLRWTVNARGEFVPHLQWVHANLFGYDRETLELGFYEAGRRGGLKVTPLSEYPDAFVVHEPMGGRSDYPWRRGAMRSCILPSFIKRNGLKFWLVAAERFGIPQVWASVPRGVDDDGEDDDSVIGNVEASLANLGRYWWAVVDEGIEFHKIDGSGQVDAKVHQGLIDWAESAQAIAMLGQNLTTKVDGGSFAASETHRWVADDIHLADAVELAETITQQIVEPVVRYNWPGAPIPICEINTGRKQVFKTEHYLAGIASKDDVRRTMGHEALPSGDGADHLKQPAQLAPVAGAPTGPTPTAPPSPADDVMPDAAE